MFEGMSCDMGRGPRYMYIYGPVIQRACYIILSDHTLVLAVCYVASSSIVIGVCHLPACSPLPLPHETREEN